MYFECVGKVPLSDSELILNSGTEPIIRFRLGFVLKLGFVPTVSILELG